MERFVQKETKRYTESLYSRRFFQGTGACGASNRERNVHAVSLNQAMARKGERGASRPLRAGQKGRIIAFWKGRIGGGWWEEKKTTITRKKKKAPKRKKAGERKRARSADPLVSKGKEEKRSKQPKGGGGGNERSNDGNGQRGR